MKGPTSQVGDLQYSVLPKTLLDIEIPLLGISCSPVSVHRIQSCGTREGAQIGHGKSHQTRLLNAAHGACKTDCGQVRGHELRQGNVKAGIKQAIARAEDCALRAER